MYAASYAMIIPMINDSLAILTVTLYSFAGILQYKRLCGSFNSSRIVPLICSFFAIIAHAVLLFHWIDQGNVQNLTVINVFSQVAWLIALLITLFAFVAPLDNLGVFIFPFAAVTVLLGWLFPGSHMVDTKAEPGQLLHILLAFLVMSIFFVAATQATLLLLQDRLLRQRQTQGMVRFLPPLETMENLLFQMISMGFILLSLVLLTSVIFFPLFFSIQLWPHTITAFLAWLVFAILLYGRKIFGWRGYKAIGLTMSGVCLVLLSYVATWLVEIFLAPI